MPVLESVLRRDRLLVVAGLAAITGLSWLYLISMASDMDDGMGMGMAAMGAASSRGRPPTSRSCF